MVAAARVTLGSLIVMACGSPAPSETPSAVPIATPPPSSQAADSGASAKPAAPPATGPCADGPTPERLEVELGRTAIARSRIAVTFKTVSHDSYDDGRTDLLLHLVFQGVGDDGRPTPSAFTWMPSALAAPSWTLLGVNRCARVVEPGERHVVIELFEPSRSAR